MSWAHFIFTVAVVSSGGCGKIELSASTNKSDLLACYLPPSSANQVVLLEQDSYLPDDVVHIECFNDTWVLRGSKAVTCQRNGTWTPSFPLCQEIDVRPTYELNTSQLLRCPPLTDVFRNGEFIVNANSTVVTYHCNAGFVLTGPDTRHCLANHTWSGTVPHCKANQQLPSTTAVPALWVQAFINNMKWEGLYEYRGRSTQFWFLVQSAKGDQVTAIFGDHYTQFELVGYWQDGSLLFKPVQPSTGNTIFPPHGNWSIVGKLTMASGHWLYSGALSCMLCGVSRLEMSPASRNEWPSSDLLSSSEDYDYEEFPSSMAMALGITMAVIAVIVAGMLAAFCVRRNVVLRSRGHETLTSFENPVYDCEIALK